MAAKNPNGYAFGASNRLRFLPFPLKCINAVAQPLAKGAKCINIDAQPHIETRERIPEISGLFFILRAVFFESFDALKFTFERGFHEKYPSS